MQLFGYKDKLNLIQGSWAIKKGGETPPFFTQFLIKDCNTSQIQLDG